MFCRLSPSWIEVRRSGALRGSEEQGRRGGSLFNPLRGEWNGMRKGMVLAGILVLLAGSRAGAAEPDTWDSLFKVQLDTYNAMAGALTSVTDEESAKAAVPKLTKLREQMEDIVRRAKKLPKPTKAEGEELKKKYGELLRAAKTGLFKEKTRVGKVPGGKVALQALAPPKKSK
jgi:hypothetical protein